jgi:exonuclease VII small subunit
MIEDIRAQAIEKARTRIAFLFHDHHSLDNNIPAIRSQLTKSLAHSESQLHMVVQNKLDSLKRAVDLMEDSSTKLEAFSQNMHKIDERIADTNSTLSEYKYLKNVCRLLSTTCSLV